MSAWAVLNSLVSSVVVIGAIGMLQRFKPSYNLSERLGLALMSGAGILRIHAVLALKASPFWDWAPTLMIVGLLLFLMGRGWRDLRHDIANRKMLKQSEAWMRGRR